MPPVILGGSYGQKPDGSLRMSDYRFQQLALIEPLLESKCCRKKKRVQKKSLYGITYDRYPNRWDGFTSTYKTIDCNHKYFTGGNMQDLCFQTFSLQPLFLPFVVFYSKSQIKYVSV